ncbi:NAD(P)-dependent oxidoreductase [Pluralibacter gergoviae]|uniref:NAD(P)-dependent oxidoreductase n=1 Tax=Pluralibacter gergoviae TaxID=61647 RepID=UPI000650261E|nr:NAD(P)-dependent oxidoreductase [Pluralibacter gergoviae]EKV0931033.1 NAD(P)-dependent oxidoreductase [Pluralibacter gergoviae]EKV6247777.1 NAD(P)-dependent oxidoreductase [Pluralibacter gergoviae]ELD4270117.1 NAD(P)-dependent oxidoreductase [Pluralibacter gergoviae]ELD4275097.1 NAD(P)-dependent oxidoreductase [Pluralibacter gergoviae]ELD4299580.1 NAD(P)-dependent oxidoreductase [Pluralibacter gergoviae]
MKTLPVVAVLGLGAMGHAFAANLLKSGFTVRGWNRSRARGEDLTAAGLILCDSAGQAAGGADVVISMLTDGDITQRILKTALPQLRQGAIVCQMGTIGVEATQALIADFGRDRPDIVFIDAPVSGSKAPAENAQIAILASGDRHKAAALEPVFAAISRRQQWLGPAGGGQRMKLVVNSYLIGLMQSLAESAALADRLGFSAETLWGALEGGPLASPYAEGKLGMISRNDFTPQMQLAHALKDARLALAAAPELALSGLQNIASLWQQAAEAGYAEQDLASVAQFIADARKG